MLRLRLAEMAMTVRLSASALVHERLQPRVAEDVQEWLKDAQEALVSASEGLSDSDELIAKLPRAREELLKRSKHLVDSLDKPPQQAAQAARNQKMKSPKKPQTVAIRSVDGQNNTWSGIRTEGYDVGFDLVGEQGIRVSNAVFVAAKNNDLTATYEALGVTPGTKPSDVLAALQAVQTANGNADEAAELVKKTPLSGKLTSVAGFVAKTMGAAVMTQLTTMLISASGS